MSPNKKMFKINATLLTMCLIRLALGASYPAKHQSSLAHIIKKTAAYSEKLKESAFQFVCHQEVNEKFIQKLHNVKSTAIPFDELTYFGKISTQHFKERRERTKYLYDYRILQKDRSIKESRHLLKINGKKVQHREKSPKTKIYSYKNALAPIDFFAKKNQRLYHYHLKGRKKLNHRQVYEVEVFKQEMKREQKLLAVFWIDEVDFSILKYQSYIGRFSTTDLAGSANHNISNIQVSNIHYFGIIKRGIRFPSKTEIVLTFNGGPLKINGKPVILPYGSQRFTKIKTQFKYKNYMFHNIRVSPPSFKI